MKKANLLQRRAMLVASIGLMTYARFTMANSDDEGKELLRAIKRVIDEDLIDQPELASQILGLAIEDYRGPNEDVRPVPVIGTTRPRPKYPHLSASIVASDQPQRITFGKVKLSVHGFHKSSGDPIRLSDADVVDVFGNQFILASTLIRPHWRPGTDFSDWSGNYPNETFVYTYPGSLKVELLVKFASQTQLSGMTLWASRRGGTK